MTNKRSWDTRSWYDKVFALSESEVEGTDISKNMVFRQQVIHLMILEEASVVPMLLQWGQLEIRIR